MGSEHRSRAASKRREATLALITGAFIVLALLTVFAVKLADTQAGSKRDVESRVHERGVLAVALIDSLFSTIQQQLPRDERLYGTATVSSRTLESQRQGNLFLALLDGSGRVVAASKGFTPQLRAELASSPALKLAHDGRLYGIGNVIPVGKYGAIPIVTRIPTPYGVRFLVSGGPLGLYSTFFGNELHKIPGVSGAHNYLIDGTYRVIASTNPAYPAGYTFKGQQVQALRQTAGDASGHYYDQLPLGNSSLHLVLAAPDGPLFASVTGLHKWLPWAIFGAFALFAVIALLLGRRTLRATEQVRAANLRLERLNGELATSNDLLERQAAELARSNSELEQFASIASHDLQEPLRKVRTFAHRLTETEADSLSERGVDYLDRMGRAAERMQRLIEDLLKFSRVATQGRPFEAVDLAEIVPEVLDDLESQIERTGATIEVGELPVVHADPLQMRQLVQNLISNAIKFHRSDVPPVVTIDSEATDDEVRLTVADNGIGFDPRYADRIFRVFERLNGRNEYEGTGIGLALCRKIADRHGGTVYAESQPDAGAKFTIVLPQDPPVDLPFRLDGARNREELHAIA